MAENESVDASGPGIATRGFQSERLAMTRVESEANTRPGRPLAELRDSVRIEPQPPSRGLEREPVQNLAAPGASGTPRSIFTPARK